MPKNTDTRFLRSVGVVTGGGVQDSGSPKAILDSRVLDMLFRLLTRRKLSLILFSAGPTVQPLVENVRLGEKGSCWLLAYETVGRSSACRTWLP